MDSQTRHALKQDKFVQATKGGVSWVEDNRSSVIRLSVIGVLILAVIIGGAIFYSNRTHAAENALGAALDVYSAPLLQPGQPAEAGIYATAAERAKAANAQFVQVASQYGWLPEGGKAHYFAGLTYQDLGQTASAEAELKKAADSYNSDLSTLGKFALAGFYHQTGRDSQAIEFAPSVFKRLAGKGPSSRKQSGVNKLCACRGFFAPSKLCKDSTLSVGRQ